MFYTLGVSASALSPFVYGILSDRAGVAATLSVIGACVFVTIPLTQSLRGRRRRPPRLTRPGALSAAPTARTRARSPVPGRCPGAR